MCGDAVRQVTLLRGVGAVDAALQHAAAVAMRGDVQAVVGGGGVDEAQVLVGHALEAALDDVVTVQVADEGHHARTQGLDHQLHLFRCVFGGGGGGVVGGGRGGTEERGLHGVGGCGELQGGVREMGTPRAPPASVDP